MAAMRLRNGEHGYGAVTKTLHWVTVALLAVQLSVGYTMEAEDDVRDAACDPPGEDASGGDTSEAEEERLDRAEERCEGRQERRESDADEGYSVLDGPLDLLDLHVGLGLAIIAVALLRVGWRRATPLPPWSPRLTSVDRKVLHWVERVLLAMLFVAPATGIALVLGSADLLALHVASHVLLYAAVAVHVFVVLRRRVLPRMLPGGGAAREPSVP